MAGKKSDAEVAAVLSKISKSHLECVICHERYREPKMLDCLHNFCKRCLVIYQESSGDPSFIKCPVCRKKMKFAPGTDVVASLKTNFHIVSMIEDFTLQEKLTQPKAMKVICELCTEQQEAQSRCMDCQFFICSSCQAIHQRIFGMAGHDIVALDTLRSSAEGPRSKVQEEPRCEKHRGEKKRFYCLTCNQLICRDCTVVEHRDPTHKFTTVDEAAARNKENTTELIQQVEENLKGFEEASTELTKMNTDLEKSMVLARQLVANQAAEERSKIAKRQENIAIDISKRHNLHTGLLYKHGIKMVSKNPGQLKDVGKLNGQIYSETIEEKLAHLDSSLTAFDNIIESLLKSDDTLGDLKSNLTLAAAKEIDEEKSKVATNLYHLLKSIGLRKPTVELAGKMTSDDILHMRQTLETASEVVKSGSKVDFLSLHPVVDSHLRLLLVQSPPRLPLGYSKMVFKSSDDTALGELILDATWTFAGEISIGQVTVNDMDTFSNDEILLSASYRPNTRDYRGQKGYPLRHTVHGYNKYQTVLQYKFLIYSANGGIARSVPVDGALSGIVATFPETYETYFCTLSGTTVNIISKSLSCLRSYAVPASVEQDGSQINLGQPVNVAYYRNQEIVISYSNWREIVILDTSNGSTVRMIPVDIKPDFLACTSRGRIFVASREPACVVSLDGNDSSSLTIHPTVAGSTDDVKEVICSGLCRDSRDIIYVAVSIEGAKEIHIHQYTSFGSFIGCLTSGNISQPVIDIGVTGNGTLVVAEQNCCLKLFETPKEEVAYKSGLTLKQNRCYTRSSLKS